MQRVVMRPSLAATMRARPLQSRAVAAADETAARLPCVTRHTHWSHTRSICCHGFYPCIAGLENSPAPLDPPLPLDPPRPCTDAKSKMEVKRTGLRWLSRIASLEKTQVCGRANNNGPHRASRTCSSATMDAEVAKTKVLASQFEQT